KRERSSRWHILMSVLHAPLGIAPEPPEQVQSWGLLLAKLSELRVQLDAEHHGIVYVARCDYALKLRQSLRCLFSPSAHSCVAEHCRSATRRPGRSAGHRADVAGFAAVGGLYPQVQDLIGAFGKSRED